MTDLPLSLVNFVNETRLEISWTRELFGAALRDAKSGVDGWPSVDALIRTAPDGSVKRTFMVEWKKELG